MINELIVLADELDRLGEKQAADFVDKLIKMAGDKEDFIPMELQPEEEFVDVPTKVDIEPLKPLHELLEEQRQKLERTFSKEKSKGHSAKKPDPRDILSQAIQMISGTTSEDFEGAKNKIMEMLEDAKNSMH